MSDQPVHIVIEIDREDDGRYLAYANIDERTGGSAYGPSPMTAAQLVLAVLAEALAEMRANPVPDPPSPATTRSAE